jgi:endonuclease YncB( thermonuclease family)
MSFREAMVALVFAAGCSSAEASSPVRVHDGDTFTLDGQRWRLWGVDAVELAQTCQSGSRVEPCGVEARDALVVLIGNANVRCEPHGKSYDRLVGRCWAGSVDLSAEMARGGWALDWQRYSHGEYAGEEREARDAHRGVWATQFTRPWEWRAHH